MEKLYFTDVAQSVAYALRIKCVESYEQAMSKYDDLYDTMTEEEHMGFWRIVDTLKGEK